MKVLVVGSGGREHAMVDALARSRRITQLYCAPGNAGIAEQAECVALGSDDVPGLLDFARDRSIDFTVVGPEAPLAAGLVDVFEEAGLAVFGPSRAAARLESSKSFCKQLMRQWRIPTASYEVFDDPIRAHAYVSRTDAPLVIKADGLAAGKGVIIAASKDEAHEAVERILVREEFGEAGQRLVIEECLSGPECSIISVCDGRSFVTLPSAQDYKRIHDGDEGPNTGGMGSYSPVPVLHPDQAGLVRELVIKPALQALEYLGTPYRGALYAGIMLTAAGPKVLEFNCRFGDPETQAILPRLNTDFLELLLAARDGSLVRTRPSWQRRASVCVVMASEGYPGAYEKGKPITGLQEAAEDAEVRVYHAGTALSNGDVVTSGGRVLGITALGDDHEQAIDRVYRAVEKVQFAGSTYRKDIGRRALV